MGNKAGFTRGISASLDPFWGDGAELESAPGSGDFPHGFGFHLPRAPGLHWVILQCLGHSAVFGSFRCLIAARTKTAWGRVKV